MILHSMYRLHQLSSLLDCFLDNKTENKNFLFYFLCLCFPTSRICTFFYCLELQTFL